MVSLVSSGRVTGKLCVADDFLCVRSCKLGSADFCELWTENFDALLAFVKEYIIDLWEVRKVKLYGESCSTQSSAGDTRDGTVVGGQRNGKFGKFSHSGRVTSKLCVDDDLLCVCSCKFGSADFCGCVVYGMIARAAS